MELSQERRKLIGRLRHRKTRVREELVLVEGVRAVAEALDAGARVRFGVTSPRLGSSQPGARTLELLKGGDADVTEVDDAELTALSDTERHQGIAIVVEEPKGDFARTISGPRCLLLDGIQDPGNVGTLVRAAVAFSVDGVVALDGTVDPWSPKAVRASAGMVFRVPIVVSPWDVVGLAVMAQGPRLIFADADGEDVRGSKEGDTFALAVGNEGAGVRKEIRDLAAASVAVPMTGPAESLNAGVAGSILLFALTEEH